MLRNAFTVKIDRTEAGQSAHHAMGLRLALLYAAIFALAGVFLPYMPVWLDARGLSAAQIALVLSMHMLLRPVFTPAVAYAADRTGARRGILIVLAAGAGLAIVLLSQAHSFIEIFVFFLLFGLFWMSVTPLTEATAMRAVREAGVDYGRVRLWGSLTFIGASIGGGAAIARWGSDAIMWLLIASAALVLLAAISLPRWAPAPALPGAPGRPLTIRDAAALAASPMFLLFLLAASLVQATHAVYYTFGTLHWQSLGISTPVIGALWSVGVLAEIALFIWAAIFLRRFGPAGLILLGAAGAVLRWTVTAFDPPLWLLFPVQALHGLSFGATHLGAVHFISDAVPEDRSSTAQGLYAAITAGFVMGAMTLAAGPLYRSLSGEAYLVMAMVGLLAVAVSALLVKRWNGGIVVAERRSAHPHRAREGGATRPAS